MSEWSIGTWQEWMISLIAFLAYRQIRAELEERRQGEQRLVQKASELEKANAALQYQLEEIKDGLAATKQNPAHAHEALRPRPFRTPDLT